MAREESDRSGWIAGLAPAQLLAAVDGDPFWAPALGRALLPDPSPVALHLAILVEPYLSHILDGRKTIESRFSRQRRTPFGQVAAGDILLFKRSGGPILGLARVAQAKDYTLTPPVLQQLLEAYAVPLCAEDAAFWEARAGAAYATLLWLDHVCSITPIPLPRRDRRGWVVLNRRAAGGHSPHVRRGSPGIYAWGGSAAS